MHVAATCAQYCLLKPAGPPESAASEEQLATNATQRGRLPNTALCKRTSGPVMLTGMEAPERAGAPAAASTTSHWFQPACNTVLISFALQQVDRQPVQHLHAALCQFWGGAAAAAERAPPPPARCR